MRYIITLNPDPKGKRWKVIDSNGKQIALCDSMREAIDLVNGMRKQGY